MYDPASASTNVSCHDKLNRTVGHDAVRSRDTKPSKAKDNVKVTLNACQQIKLSTVRQASQARIAKLVMSTY